MMPAKRTFPVGVILKAFINLFLVALVIHSVHKSRLEGDGGEYLMVTHALYKHGSVCILPSDFADFLSKSSAELTKIGYPGDLYRQLLDKFREPQPASWAGYASVAPNRLYSIHFWMYSVLALPFYALVSMFGWQPWLSFGLLNAASVLGVYVYLRRAFPQAVTKSMLLFMLMGASFYLNWSGPEQLTACCLLVATLAALRRESGFAILCAALASTQNPPAIFLLPFIALARLAPPRWALLQQEHSRPLLNAVDIALALLGLAIAALPYAFFHSIFGVASLTGHYFTLPSLIGMDRLISLYFDLDQGLVAGLPGLLLLILGCAVCLQRADRNKWLCYAAAAVAATLAMSIPVLSALNWNSGSVVLARYAYWLGMPLLAVALCAFQDLSTRRRWLCLVLALAPQCLVFVEEGLLGDRYTEVSHSPLASWVLAKQPTLYNPEPEIFYERGIGHEVNVPLDTSLNYVYKVGGRPVKALGNVGNPDSSFGICKPGEQLLGSAHKDLGLGWYYEHAPFRCIPIPHYVKVQAWSLASGQQGAASASALMGPGWSEPEIAGCWSLGQVSELRLPIKPTRGKMRLRLAGHYYADIKSSQVSINGRRIKPLALNYQTIELQPGDIVAGQVVIKLTHPDAISPLMRGESKDARVLAYYLESVEIDVAE